jgi:hypothetical protein
MVVNVTTKAHLRCAGQAFLKRQSMRNCWITRNSPKYAQGRQPVMRNINHAHNRIIPRSLTCDRQMKPFGKRLQMTNSVFSAD